ncbi:recombinase family protein, partial [Campylobacter jejuni]|nr:recombinase family protein [Campylobacter jejuni]
MNIAYIRVSTNKQELDSQKLEIMEYCHKNNIHLDEILEVKISSTKSQEKRKIKDLKQKLKADDLLIATELSRLGRSMLEI